MAFGINRAELTKWKERVRNGEIAFLTHYWLDERFPDCYTVTKVGCSDIEKLVAWGKQYGLKREWLHENTYPHFDLFSTLQKTVLQKEGLDDHIDRFQL